MDGDTKNKLQGLIQSHMSKLLMRIDEENQSIKVEFSKTLPNLVEENKGIIVEGRILKENLTKQSIL